jgi:hypothetical protein
VWPRAKQPDRLEMRDAVASLHVTYVPQLVHTRNVFVERRRVS